jgi:hypothetical protein
MVSLGALLSGAESYLSLKLVGNQCSPAAAGGSEIRKSREATFSLPEAGAGESNARVAAVPFGGTRGMDQVEIVAPEAILAVVFDSGTPSPRILFLFVSMSSESLSKARPLAWSLRPCWRRAPKVWAPDSCLARNDHRAGFCGRDGAGGRRWHRPGSGHRSLHASS